MTLSAWGKSIGVTRTTPYAWRKKGMLVLGLNGAEPLNINGRIYIREDEDAEFWRRANAGEFKGELSGIAAVKS